MLHGALSSGIKDNSKCCSPINPAKGIKGRLQSARVWRALRVGQNGVNFSTMWHPFICRRAGAAVMHGQQCLLLATVLFNSTVLLNRISSRTGFAVISYGGSSDVLGSLAKGPSYMRLFPFNQAWLICCTGRYCAIEHCCWWWIWCVLPLILLQVC